jgi:hypothetical protein
MDEDSFREYLRKQGKSKSAIENIVIIVREYESIMAEEGIKIETALTEDLEFFILIVEQVLGEKANRRLWGITAFYEFLERSDMAKHAASLRRKRIKAAPFSLAKFRGVKKKHIDNLARIGIKNIEQMIKRGRTPELRMEIAEQTSIPIESVLEYVKLSDLTRLGAVRTVRARLYHDSGVDTIEKVAQYDPIELRSYLQKWIEETGFDGIAPLPKEAANAVNAAKRLPRIVEYE